MEFPTALLGVALGTVLLPSLTKAHGEGDPARVSALIDWGLRLVVILAVPASIGLALLAEPLAASLFHYGAFGADDLAKTAQAMVAYSVGLLGLIGVKVLASGFYAQQNMRTPVKIALFTLVLTQLLNLVFVPTFAHAGLALATSVAAICNAGLLLIGLRQRGSYTPAPGWWWLWLRVLLAGTAMAALCWYSVAAFDWVAMQATPLVRLTSLFGIVVAAAASYLFLLTLMRLRWQDFIRRTP